MYIDQKLHRAIAIYLSKKSCQSINKIQSYSCFSTILSYKDGGGDYIVDELHDNFIYCRGFDGDLWINETQIPLGDIYKYNLLTTYIFEPNYFYIPKEKKSLFSIYLLCFTRYPYFFNKLYKIICENLAILHLNKEASANEKNQLLKFIIKKHLNNGKKEIQTSYILNKFFHTYSLGNQASHINNQRMELYLTSLVDSGDIINDGGKIRISGKAINTINEFDSAKSQQRISFVFQILMTLATIAIAYFTYKLKTNK